MPIEKFRLTERRLMTMIMTAMLVCFGLTLAVAYFHQHAKPVEPGPRQIVRVMPENRIRQDQHYFYADMFDPSLMSLPNAKGFSRAEWLRETNETLGVYEPNVILAYLPATAPAAIPELLGQPTLADEICTVVTKLPAATQESRETFVNLPVGETSAVEVTGNLETRRLLVMPSLPVVTNATGLRPTRLRIAVTGDGTVRYAMLERTCGNVAVDGLALDAARRVRFELERVGDSTVLTWGTLRFAWATIAGK